MWQSQYSSVSAQIGIAIAKQNVNQSSYIWMLAGSAAHLPARQPKQAAAAGDCDGATAPLAGGQRTPGSGGPAAAEPAVVIDLLDSDGA